MLLNVRRNWTCFKYRFFWLLFLLSLVLFHLLRELRFFLNSFHYRRPKFHIRWRSFWLYSFVAKFWTLGALWSQSLFKFFFIFIIYHFVEIVFFLSTFFILVLILIQILNLHWFFVLVLSVLFSLTFYLFNFSYLSLCHVSECVKFLRLNSFWGLTLFEFHFNLLELWQADLDFICLLDDRLYIAR